MKHKVIALAFAVGSALSVLGVPTPVAVDNVAGVYENDAIVRRNGSYYNNRPLYAGQNAPQWPYYWVFTGDQPFIRFGGNPWMDGCFMPGFRRADGSAKWLKDFSSREFRYLGGHSEWVLTDKELPGVTVRMHAVVLAEGEGMAVQFKFQGAGPDDKLIWLLGAAYRKDWVNLYDANAVDTAYVRHEGFVPAQAEGNTVEVKDGIVRVAPPAGEQHRHTLTACSAASEIRVADADQWQTPAALLASTGGKCPVACALTPIQGETPITLVSRAWRDTEKNAKAPEPAKEFAAGVARVEALNRRVVSHTPDGRFDFMVKASIMPADGLWNYSGFRHGCISAFPIPLLGWRSPWVGTAYGWHDRVYTAAKNFFASQVTGESYKDQPELAKIIDNNQELDRYIGTLSHPGRDPRFHSKGRLIPNQNSTMYDMQSQFFDAVVEDWRFSADPEMEKLLRPALELHLGYIERCFDPDGDGTYESLPNTFLTDSVWFSGGGTPEQSGFAWRGHLAARDMAKRAGDKKMVEHHEKMLARIRKGFFEKLWHQSGGHPGAYHEYGGEQRLHTDAWMPGIAVALDSPGLLTLDQMASSLRFTEWSWEHEKRPGGGVRVYPSNWVPTLWSNRSKSPGDEHHLALGYCFAGLPEGAMDIINGHLSEMAFESPVPGSLGVPYASCGTDFGDCVAGFTRVVVSGVFGYRPDRPNGLVTIAPQFPAAWDYASFEHPAFKLNYKREGKIERLNVELKEASVMDCELPFRGTGVKSVTLNGKTIKGTVKPGFNRSIYVVRTPVTNKAEIVLEVEETVPVTLAQQLEVDAGAALELSAAPARITEIRDAQGLLAASKISEGKLYATVSGNAGQRRLLARVETGTAPQLRIFDLNIRDRMAEAFAAEKNLRQAPQDATWSGVDLAGVLNGRVSEIYRQAYVSPRPDTVSTCIAIDGHGVWNACYTGKQAPGIDLSNTRALRPVPVYSGELSDLKLGNELTLELWASAEMVPSAGACILDLDGLSVDILPFSGRLVRFVVNGTPIVHHTAAPAGDHLLHLALVLRTGEGGRVYFDGKKTPDPTVPVDVGALKLGLVRIGQDKHGQRRLCGKVARVSIAKRAASAEEISNRTLASAPLPGAVADWRFEEEAPARVVSGVAGAPDLTKMEVAFTRPADLPQQLPVEKGMLTVPQGAKFNWNPGAKDIAFTSMWDNWPKKVSVPVNKKGSSVWALIAGSTNPMQVRIANAVLRFEYVDGKVETLELVNPMNFWCLSPFLQGDYNYGVEKFSLPKEPPAMAQLGSHCRAMVYGWKLRPDVELKQVTLETLSQEVVIGLMGLSVCRETL
jgi:hypothetical protein